MLREKKLKGALMGITATLSCPVTIKMRTGWDMNDPFAHKLVGKIQSWQMDGIGAIMVGSISHSQNSFPDTHRYSSRVSILDSVNSPLVQ
jgi:tRNA-dihydrouridine synthase 3